jgi:hypothetical protein
MTDLLSTMPPTSSEDPTRRDFLYVATAAVGTIGAAATLIPLVDQMNPDASTLVLDAFRCSSRRRMRRNLLRTGSEATFVPVMARNTIWLAVCSREFQRPTIFLSLRIASQTTRRFGSERIRLTSTLTSLRSCKSDQWNKKGGCAERETPR